jgi:hypothetical protein
MTDQLASSIYAMHHEVDALPSAFGILRLRDNEKVVISDAHLAYLSVSKRYFKLEL